MRHAIVRPPGDCFRRAISSHPDRTIRPDRAAEQHRAYRDLLGSLGLQLVVLPPDEEHPDACFPQDLAVVLGGRALLARPRHETRRGEAAGVARALQPLVESLEHVAGPATLEGGDVLRVGDRVVVGRSSRTDERGIRALRDFAEPLGFEVRVARVPPGTLHLQTGVVAIGDTLVLGRPDLTGQPAFEGLDRIPVAAEEPDACNVLAVGEDVVASGAYRSHEVLERRGYRVHPVELSEFLLADGGPTCLALLVCQPARTASPAAVPG